MFKKGYNIVVESWENDADAENTKTVILQDINEVRFFNEMLKLFESRDDDLSISNECESDGNVEYLLSSTRDLMKKHEYYFFEKENKSFAATQNKKFEPIDYSDDDALLSCIHQKMEYFIGYSEYYGFRVCEKVEVYFLNEDMRPLNLQKDPNRTCENCGHYGELPNDYMFDVGCTISAGLICDVYSGPENKWIPKGDSNV